MERMPWRLEIAMRILSGNLPDTAAGKKKACRDALVMADILIAEHDFEYPEISMIVPIMNANEFKVR